MSDQNAVPPNLAQSFSTKDEQFRLLVQGVTDYAIYLLSPDGIVTNWNAGAQRIKGFSEVEVVGTHFSRFYSLEDRIAGLPQKALLIAAEAGRFEQEGLRVRRDGSTFWAHVIVDAIRDADGRLVGFGKVTRDVTEKKDTAEALALANASLFQAQKMEALGKLTGGFAHDFNNLLSVVTTGLDVLTAQYPMVEGGRTVDSMRRSLGKAATLTRQLLAFARQEPLIKSVVDLNALIRDFEPVLRRAGDATIRYVFDLGSSEIRVELDAARFETTLLNLVVNACHAMPQGGQLTIRTHIVKHEAERGLHNLPNLAVGDYAQVTVTDAGHGMSSEVMKRVFEPFFTTKELGKGTGLGLSQVYGFITQSGGDVVVNSIAGTGATFSLFLPLTTSTVAVADGDAAAEVVLIVDDQEDLLQVTSELFQALGFKTFIASNAQQALQIMQAENINLLFTDIIMPNSISGLELAVETRRRFPTIKIILASGHAIPALQSSGQDLQQFPFITKPYQLADLAKKLRSLH